MAAPFHDHPPDLLPSVVADREQDPDGDIDGLLQSAIELADLGVAPEAAVRELAESEGAPAWRITDLGGAEWAMRKVAEARAAGDALREQRERWERQIDAWYWRAASHPSATVAFFADHLERWAVEQRDATGVKTQTLPSGQVATTASRPKVVVVDEAAVVAWADAHLADAAEDVAPVPPRKVYLNPLREHVQIVEVVDHAVLIMAGTGELIEWFRAGFEPRTLARMRHEGVTCPAVGDGWPTPEDATDLIARVDVLASHYEVHGPDGTAVPGCEVDPGGVTATVRPAAPAVPEVITYGTGDGRTWTVPETLGQGPG